MAVPVSPPIGGQVHSHSVCSLYSITEGSEPISENDEIQCVIEFRNMGDRAFGEKEYVEAIKCYSEALEIDNSHADLLSARAAVYMETKQYHLAQKDAELLVKISPLLPQGHYLLAVSLDNQGYYDKAITSFLNAIDHDAQHQEQLVDNIAVVASNFCNFSDYLLKKFEVMDPGQKLSEVGMQLFRENYHDLCVDVLTRSRTIQPQDTKHSMWALITLASSYLTLKERAKAKKTFQECLHIAKEEKDLEFESKCYVNLANIHLIENDTQQAIVYYEKLLSIGVDLSVQDGGYPEYWSVPLRCGIHENLSIAYRELHNYPLALLHAKEHVKLVEENKGQESSVPMAYYNLASYHEMVNDYTAALANYNTFLTLSKEQGNKVAMATAYASLGKVYSIICNFKLSETYLEQYLNMTQKMRDYDGQCTALCHLGELYQAQGDYMKALSYFERYLRTSRRLDEYESECRAFLKVGDAYKCQGRYQHSQYYYEMAATIADKLDDNEDLVNQCRREVSFALTSSVLKDDMEKAKSVFEELIPVYSNKIQQFEDENIECPQELKTALEMCYDGMQISLCKLGRPDEALEYAEAFRHQKLQLILKQKLSRKDDDHSGKSTEHVTMPTRDELCKIVNQQKGTVLYYSITDQCLLIWVLKPGEGVVKAHVEKAIGSDSCRRKVQHALEQLQRLHGKKQDLDCEKRALPSKNRTVKHLQMKNLAKSTESKPKQESDDDQVSGKNLSAERQLYELIIAPVQNTLIDVTHLLFITDKELCQVPMDVLTDEKGASMNEKYHIISVPSLSVQKLLMTEVDESDSRQQTLKSQDFFPVYLDDHLRVVIPPDEQPFSPIKKQLRSAPVMAKEKSSSPSFITFGSNYHDYVPTPREKQDREQLIVAQEKSKVGTLITRSSTGMEVMGGEGTVVDYKQDTQQYKSLVIGNPTLPKKLKLHEQIWCPAGELIISQCEAYNIAEYLDTKAILGVDANKGNVLSQLTQATLVHIGTYGSWEDSVLVFGPNPTSQADVDGSYTEDQYQIGSNDIMNIKLKADLVVLSCCYGDMNRPVDFTLPTALLAAGARCVLLLLWSVPDVARDKFWYHFYNSLQYGNYVSVALANGKQSLAKDERFSDPMYWAPFLLVGHDVFINIHQIKQSMLDQLVDNVETETMETMSSPPLNLSEQPVEISSKMVTLPKLRHHLSKLLIHHYDHPKTIAILLQLVSDSLVLQRKPQKDLLTRKLPKSAMITPGSIPLLNLLGFHFQAKGANNTEPYVVFPHWDHDGLIQPAYQALQALTDITVNSQCSHALSKLLPGPEDVLSGLLDIVSVTIHSWEVQLKVSDTGVRSLWGHHLSRELLISIGFQQVGIFLLFNNTVVNRKLLDASLHVLSAVLGDKGHAMLNRVDISYLGVTKSPPIRLATTPLKLPSLKPVMLSRNRVHMSTPWLTVLSEEEEKQLKMQMARSLSDIDSEYRYHMMKAHDWHDYSLKPQAAETIDVIGQPKHKPHVVKVLPGKGTSFERVPVDTKPTLNTVGTEQRRDYGHYLLHSRSESILQRHREASRKVFLPYVKKLTPAE